MPAGQGPPSLLPTHPPPPQPAGFTLPLTPLPSCDSKDWCEALGQRGDIQGSQEPWSDSPPLRTQAPSPPSGLVTSEQGLNLINKKFEAIKTQ